MFSQYIFLIFIKIFSENDASGCNYFTEIIIHTTSENISTNCALCCVGNENALTISKVHWYMFYQDLGFKMFPPCSRKKDDSLKINHAKIVIILC